MSPLTIQKYLGTTRSFRDNPVEIGRTYHDLDRLGHRGPRSRLARGLSWQNSRLAKVMGRLSPVLAEVLGGRSPPALAKVLGGPGPALGDDRLSESRLAGGHLLRQAWLGLLRGRGLMRLHRLSWYRLSCGRLRQLRAGRRSGGVEQVWSRLSQLWHGCSRSRRSHGSQHCAACSIPGAQNMTGAGQHCRDELPAFQKFVQECHLRLWPEVLEQSRTHGKRSILAAAADAVSFERCETQATLRHSLVRATRNEALPLREADLGKLGSHGLPLPPPG